MLNTPCREKWGICSLSYMVKSISCTSHYFPYSDHSKSSPARWIKNIKDEVFADYCLLMKKCIFDSIFLEYRKMIKFMTMAIHKIRFTIFFKPRTCSSYFLVVNLV